MTGSTSLEVEVEVADNLYLVEGFASKQEAKQFVVDLDGQTGPLVDVRGPF